MTRSTVRMRADFKVVLDACVLAPPALCDLLLRLAERPRLYSPRWGKDILDEVHRTQVNRLGFPPELADYWRTEVETHFPEALIENYAPLIDICDNDEKDRHVLATAIRAGAELIVTSNLRHFPNSCLENWDIHSRHPSEFLINLYTMDSGIVVSKLVAIAEDRKVPPQRILGKLTTTVPAFSKYNAEDLNWILD